MEGERDIGLWRDLIGPPAAKNKDENVFFSVTIAVASAPLHEWFDTSCGADKGESVF